VGGGGVTGKCNGVYEGYGDFYWVLEAVDFMVPHTFRRRSAGVHLRSGLLGVEESREGRSSNRNSGSFGGADVRAPRDHGSSA
jgi:hypothetical protein